MNNIFEGAYFGKAYKTRDGRKAIYNYHSSGGYHDIIIDKEGMSYHFADHTNGILRLPHPSEIKPDVDYSCPIDIVSEWTEEVDEGELDELLMQLLICAQQGYTQCAPDDVVIRNMKKILKEEEEDRQWILQNLCLATL